MLLINPPLVKPSEPPVGLARLAGALSFHNIPYNAIDCNLEGILFLLNQETSWMDTWSKRAQAGVQNNIISMQSPTGYKNKAKYRRHISDINRLLQGISSPSGVRVSLSDYKDTSLSPANREDLLTAFHFPENNIFYPFYKKRLGKELNKSHSTSIGISVNYLSQALPAFSLAGFIKAECPEKKVIIGGGLITSWMAAPHWNDPFSTIIDQMVKGPGEDTLLKLEGVNTEQSEYLPNYDKFPLDSYFSPVKMIPYNTSFGCYWSKCTFCPERYEKNRYFQEQHTLININKIKERYAPELIHFTDSTLSPEMLKLFADNPLTVPWFGFSRIIKEFEDQGFCDALKNSGCTMLKLGIESGDQNVLNELCKGVTVKRISTSLKNLKKSGISVYGYLLFGTPQENEETARKTLSFIIEHAEYIDFLNLALFNMPSNYPDAKEFERSEFYEGDLSIYTNFTHPKAWGRKKIRRFLDKEFSRHPAIAPIIQNDPHCFTSNHAPFFL